MNTGRSRRWFLKRAVPAVAAPAFIPASVFGSAAPSRRLTMGCIGVGGQGTHDMRAFLFNPGVQVVAVCDVDSERAHRAKGIVESHYAAKQKNGRWKGCTATGDFREILARDDIDTVMIATPDHWHALISIEAARHGKDIYCEKPMSYSVAEGRAVVEAMERHGRIFQTGTQRRSSARIRRGCELVRNGRIGRLQTVRVGLPGGFAIRGGNFSGIQPPMPVPEGFDYDMWLGPAPWAPYTKGRCHFNFRWILDYGEGYISDWGAHYLDVAQWGMGTDSTGPVEIEATARFPREGLYDAPTDFHIVYTYANGVKLICSNKETLGMRFEGDEGWIHLEKPGVGVVAEPAGILESEIGPDEVHLGTSRSQHGNFIECVRTRCQPTAPAEIGHRSATVCHLGMIAALVGRKMKWDPSRETFVNDPGANRLLSRPMRAPWSALL